jgi:hypothetical protein
MAGTMTFFILFLLRDIGMAVTRLEVLALGAAKLVSS